jgi:ABC-type oligopeptide transport system substrate-binding subunit
VFPIANAQQIAAGKLPPETLGVHAADDFTLRVRLKAPAAHFLKLVSSEALAPVPRRAVSSDRTSWTRAGQMPSCGPFLLHEWKPQDRIILRKNPHYYNAAGVRLDSIVFLPVRDGATGVNLYKTGNAHAMHGRAVPPLWIPALREKRDFHATQSLYNRLLAFNTTQPPFNNRLLRYAFNMATDKEEITRFLSGGQMPARTVVPSFGGYKCAEAVHIDADGRTWDILAYDPEAARALMKISGVETPVLNLTFPNRNRSKEIAQIIQKQWSRNLGAIVTLLMLEWNVWIQTILSLNYTGVIESGGGADYADPNSFFEFFTGRGDGSGWIDPEFNRLVDDANTVADPDERMRRLAACELRLLRAMPVLPLFFDTFCFLQKPFVRGLTPNILDVPQFKSAWIDTHWRPQ